MESLQSKASNGFRGPHEYVHVARIGIHADEVPGNRCSPCSLQRDENRSRLKERKTKCVYLVCIIVMICRTKQFEKTYES